jgi:nucleoside-diphosphate-sugar epimerase
MRRQRERAGQVISRTVLITGAAGFIGSHLTERCLQLGWRVRALDAFTDYYEESIKRSNLDAAAGHERCDVIEGDLLDLDLAPLLDGVQTVFHLAAQPGVRASWAEFDRYTRLNLDATHRLLQAATEATLERFVLSSSSSVYGDAETMPTGEGVAPRPVSPYGVTKLAMEHLARAYSKSFGVPTVCLRYFTVYGPRQRPDMAFKRLIDAALKGRTFEVFGDGAQTRDFTFIADAVSGTVATALRGTPGSVYNIGGGSRRSMNSVFVTLETLLQAPIERRYIARQLGDARDTAADISRARGELGFEPSVALEAGLAAQLEWQRAGLTRSAAIADAGG